MVYSLLDGYLYSQQFMRIYTDLEEKRVKQIKQQYCKSLISRIKPGNFGMKAACDDHLLSNNQTLLVSAL